MAFQLQFVGTPAAAITAINAMTATNLPGEQAFLARAKTFLVAEVNNLGAVNQVQCSIFGTHTEKTSTMDYEIDKATGVLGGQVIQLAVDGGIN